MKVAISGATGRMGQAIVRIAKERGISIVGAMASASSSHAGRDVGELAGIGTVGVAISPDLASGLLGADVVIDFSSPECTRALIPLAARAGVAIVSGTTGLDANAERALDAAAQRVPTLWSPNTSMGVHVLAKLVEIATRELGPEFDIEIVESHHRKKADAPSGTAIRLAQAAEGVRSTLRQVRGRNGAVGARKQEEIGVHALRGGDVIGEHTVHFFGPGERLELTHRASSRDLFARGAVRAAEWIAGKPAKRYSMADLIG